MEDRASDREVEQYAPPQLVRVGSLTELTLTPISASGIGGDPWSGDHGYWKS